MSRAVVDRVVSEFPYVEQLCYLDNNNIHDNDERLATRTEALAAGGEGGRKETVLASVRWRRTTRSKGDTESFSGNVQSGSAEGIPEGTDDDDNDVGVHTTN